MKHLKVKDFVPLAIIAFIISIILNVYAYSIIKTSRISGISPFKHKIIWCQKKRQAIPEEYKNNDRVIDFPKEIFLKLSWNLKGEFMQVWHNGEFHTYNDFRGLHFIYEVSSWNIFFEKEVQSLVKGDPDGHPFDRIVFFHLGFSPIYDSLWIDYLSGELLDTDIYYECVDQTELSQNLKKGEGDVYRYEKIFKKKDK